MDAQNFINAFENFGQFLYHSLNDTQSMYAASFILIAVLLYALMLALVTKLPMFTVDGKANGYGKALSLVFSLLCTLAMFKLTEGQSAKDVVTQALKMYGVFAGAVLAILFFAIIFFGFGKKEEGRWQLTVTMAGFAMALSGYFISVPMVQATGWLIGIIGLILYISSAGIIAEAKIKKSENEKP